MEFQHVQFNSDEYRQSLILRETILRAPLGLDLSEDDLEGEERQLHFVMLEAGRVVAGVVGKPVAGDPQTIKVRQMAVEEGRRGQGVGARLLRGGERCFRELGYERVVMHARVTAQRFYEKQGYAAEGEVFREVTIPHIKMAKQLSL